MAWIDAVWRRWFHRLSGRPPDPGPTELALEQASAFGRQALRAIVGRKRRHDLVRRHELEELRLWRRQGLVSPHAIARDKVTDFAASDLLDDPLEREKTLEKIDVIEAQMARHWWRGKVIATHVSTVHAPASAADANGDTHMRTEPPLPVEASDFAPTRAATLLMPQEDTEFLPTQTAGGPTADLAWPTVASVAVPAAELELREAALLWARGQTEATLTLLQAALAGASEGGPSFGLHAALDDVQQASAGQGQRLVGPVASLDARVTHADGRWVLDCTDWHALDFAAAGSILNWVQARQGEGRRVELHHVRPLLAALFAALEIDGLVRIVPAA